MQKLILIGNVGKEPEAADGRLKFSVATSEKYTNKAGEKVEDTEWHNVVLWGKYADILAKHLKKGQKVYVEGKIKTSTFEKDGNKMKSTSVNASVVEIVNWGDKKENTDSSETIPF